MKKIKEKLVISVVSFLVFVKKVMAQSNWSDPTGETPASFGDIEIIFSNILNVVLSLAGVAVFLMLIIAGFKLLTAGGNPEQAKSAKSTITWAVIGLIVMLGSWFVIQLIKEFTGVDVTEFEVPGDPGFSYF